MTNVMIISWFPLRLMNEFRQKPLVTIDHCSFLSLPCMLSAHFFDKVF